MASFELSTQWPAAYPLNARAEALMLKTQADQRGAQRIHLCTPISVRWTSAANHEDFALTRDVSISGVFFFLNKTQEELASFHVREGDEVAFNLVLPLEITGSQDKETRMYCAGRVVRVEISPGAKLGIAATIESHYLCASDVPQARGKSSSKIRHQPAPAQEVEETAAPDAAPYSRQRHSIRALWFLLVLLLGWISASYFWTPKPAVIPAHGRANVEVWADTRTGLYHCPGGEWYGRTDRGKYLSEEEAYRQGFRPVFGGACK